MVPFTAICINNAGRPNEIPQNVWEKLKNGELYTVIKVTKLNIQGGQYGYQLAEIDLSPYEPYIYFAANRFAIPVNPKEKEEIEELELV